MRLIIRFTEQLVCREGRGWSSSYTSGVYPLEFIHAVEDTHTLSLLNPTRLEIRYDLLFTTWQDAERTITVFSPLKRIKEIRIVPND